MYNFDIDEIKQQITEDMIFDLLLEWDSEPQHTSFGIISATICHNPAGEGSHKLYYYSNSNLFHCYSGCDEPSFDIIELVIKIAHIQWHQNYSLYDAMEWLAYRLGLTTTVKEKSEQLDDWEVLKKYDTLIKTKENTNIVLPEYNSDILKHLNYKVKIKPWLDEGITEEMIRCAEIGYYPPTDQITIPHFDAEGRFVGLRGRTVCQEDAEIYGKYRPVRINQKLYNHPLGFNLYGLNWNKKNIQTLKIAVVAESEKSVLKYGSFFGQENNICVACCGSSISNYQVSLLLKLGVREMIIAFDKQFQELGDNEAKQWEKKLRKLQEKYKNEILISIIWDKQNLLNYKESPMDRDKETYLELFKNRIILP